MTYRLLKVICMPVLVLEDDAGHLVELTAQPVNVAAADWFAYPALVADQIDGLNNNGHPPSLDSHPPTVDSRPPSQV